MKYFRFTKYTLILLLVVVGFFAWGNSASAASNVYYSVGQSAADLKSGSPTVTITSGAAVFSVAQSANIGVGDRVTYNTNSIAYISAKTNADQMHWTLITATGGVPTNITGSTVVSIKHEYTSLSVAIVGANDSTHLNTSNLVTGNYILNIPCYYDSAADTTAVTVSGYTTGASNYIKIYTPNNTATQANNSQRHSGQWDNSKYTLTSNYSMPLYIPLSNVWVDGLQFYNSHVDSIGIGWDSSSSAYTGWRISNNIVRGSGPTGGGYGIICFNTTGPNEAKVWNNLVYGFGYGIGLAYQNESKILNNTIVDCGQGFHDYGNNTNVAIKNNLINCADAFNGTFADDDSLNNYNSISENNSGEVAIGTNGRHNQTFTFVDPTNKDFHLSGNDTGAKDHGANLSADANLPFSTDIDGDTRSGLWDIGADEYSAPSASCGDGTCNGSETHATCPADCPLTANTDGATIIGAEGGGAKTIINSPLSAPFGNSGLVGYWSFDGPDTTWTSATAGTTNDLSGNNNTGTMTNMSRSTSPTPGISGQGLKFDGVDDYVNTGNYFSAVMSGASRTISTWVKPNSASSGYPICLGRGYGNAGFGFTPTSGKWVAHYWSWTVASFISTANVVTGQWSLVTLVQSGSTVTLYVNGVYSGQATDGGNVDEVDVTAYIGARNGYSSGVDFFNGSIDEVRIYNRALSASEVQELYQQGQRRVKIKAD